LCVLVVESSSAGARTNAAAPARSNHVRARVVPKCDSTELELLPQTAGAQQDGATFAGAGDGRVRGAHVLDGSLGMQAYRRHGRCVKRQFQRQARDIHRGWRLISRCGRGIIHLAFAGCLRFAAAALGAASLHGLGWRCRVTCRRRSPRPQQGHDQRQDDRAMRHGHDHGPLRRAWQVCSWKSVHFSRCLTR